MSAVSAFLLPLAQNAPCGELGMLPAFAGIFVLFYFLMIRPQSRERARRAEMLKNLKKNDRIVTIGGIHGVVTNVQPESNEVTIKVDEANNTRLRVSRGSIHEVLTEPSTDTAS